MIFAFYKLLIQLLDTSFFLDIATFGARPIKIIFLSYSFVATSKPLLADSCMANSASTTTNDSTTEDGSDTLKVALFGTTYNLDKGPISEIYHVGEVGPNYFNSSGMGAHLQINWEI